MLRYSERQALRAAKNGEPLAPEKAVAIIERLDRVREGAKETMTDEERAIELVEAGRARGGDRAADAAIRLIRGEVGHGVE